MASQKHPDRVSEMKSNYDMFRTFLPIALEDLLGAEPSGEIPVVIASHDGFIQNLQCDHVGTAKN